MNAYKRLLSCAAALATVLASPVPAVAAPADPLAPFHHQRLTWHDCAIPDLDAAGVRCTDVTVPLDYAHPRGRSITVSLSRSVAPDAAHRIGSMVFNLGGPAIPVLPRVLDARQAMGDAGARFDLIGLDPRFTGPDTPLDCGWPETWLPRSAGADRESFDRMVTLSAGLAGRCAKRDGNLLRYASTANQARDMDIVRAALGDPALSYLGYSYGTYLGALYTQMFPQRAGRIVLDSALDPARPGVIKGEPGPQREAALRDWAGWAAGQDPQFHLGTTAAQVLATVDKIYRASAVHPLRVGGYQVDDTSVAAVLLDPLSDDGDANNVDLAERVQVLALAADSGRAEPTPALEQALAGLLTGADSGTKSTRTAIMCADAAVPRDPEAYWRDTEAGRAAAPLFGPVDSVVSPCAFWPFTPAAPVRVHNAAPAMVVQAAGDINALLDLGQAMHHALTGSRMVTLDGVRTHGVYLFQGNACVDGAVGGYLTTGVLPAADLTCTR